MICLKPKSTSKNCFRHTSHVLCTCAFLIWIFDKSKNNRANFLILSHLEELNVSYIVWKNQPKRTKAAQVMAIQSFDVVRATIVLTLNGLIWGDFARGPQNQKIQKFLQYIKWICSGKEKLRGTRVFRFIQCKQKKLWKEKASNLLFLLVFCNFSPEIIKRFW